MHRERNGLFKTFQIFFFRWVQVFCNNCMGNSLNKCRARKERKETMCMIPNIHNIRCWCWVFAFIYWWSFYGSVRLFRFRTIETKHKGKVSVSGWIRYIILNIQAKHNKPTLLGLVFSIGLKLVVCCSSLTNIEKKNFMRFQVSGLWPCNVSIRNRVVRIRTYWQNVLYTCKPQRIFVKLNRLTTSVNYQA